MRIYIASRFAYRLLCDYVARDLEAAGHEITYKWFHAELAVKASEQNINDARMKEVALLEKEGVLSADAVLHLVDDVGGTGSWVECGLAFAVGVPVFAMSARGDGPVPYRSIFDTLYEASVADLAEFKTALKALALKKRGKTT